MFKILEQKEDCVLLKRNDSISFKVMDIESDVIYIGKDIDKATEIFRNYDINEVRKEKEEIFYKWLEEYAQA